MDKTPLEYIWQYNPVTGRVAGAHQNYGERINILHANNYLFQRMREVQRKRNADIIDKGMRGLEGGRDFNVEVNTENFKGPLTKERFVNEFPPVVYENPFDGPNFPSEFNPFFSPNGNEFSDLSGGWISHRGQNPRLNGGAVSLTDFFPQLGKA